MIINILHNALLASNKNNKSNSNNLLTFTAQEDNSTIKLTKNGSPVVDGLQYRTNIKDEWSTYTIGATTGDTITLTNIGDYVQFQNTNEELSKGGEDYVHFIMTGKIAASGNIQSMLNYSESCSEYCYYYMFKNCTSLTKAPDLPATTLAEWCYSYMFDGCTSLTKAPDLPATTLASHCYYWMFNRCSNLEFDFNSFIKKHKNSKLAEYCFAGMVYGCAKVNANRGLIAVEDLAPALSLQYGCYNDLYTGCTSITEIPENYLTDICSSTTDCSMVGFGGWFSRLY